jgi:hypothetical protein
MRRLSLWWDTEAAWDVSGKTRLLVKTRLGHPRRVVVLDGGKSGLAEEFQAVWLALDVIVDAKCHIRKKWWLRPTEVVGSIGIEDLSVVANAEAEMLDHGHAEIRASVDEETESLHVAVPSVQLVEAAARNDEWQTPEVWLSLWGILNTLHSYGKQARSIVQIANVFVVIRTSLFQPLNIQAHMWVFSGDARVVLKLLRCTNWNVDARARV